MSPYKCESCVETEPESFASCYRRQGSRLLSSTATKYNTAPSVSLIITACVPTKITPFIHPRRVPTLLRVPPTPPVFSLDSSLLHSPSCYALMLQRTSSLFSIVCLWNFTSILCTTAREIIICNNTHTV